MVEAQRRQLHDATRFMQILFFHDTRYSNIYKGGTW